MPSEMGTSSRVLKFVTLLSTWGSFQEFRLDFKGIEETNDAEPKGKKWLTGEKKEKYPGESLPPFKE